jgi:putative FmdB family regulatory protein
MPRYDYHCPIHGEIEIEHSIHTVINHCPKCLEDNVKTDVKRLISKTSFVLEGQGWSKDNYAKH